MIPETPHDCLFDLIGNLPLVLKGILINGEPTKEQIKRIEHRLKETLECLEFLRLKIEEADGK